MCDSGLGNQPKLSPLPLRYRKVDSEMHFGMVLASRSCALDSWIPCPLLTRMMLRSMCPAPRLSSCHLDSCIPCALLDSVRTAPRLYSSQVVSAFFTCAIKGTLHFDIYPRAHLIMPFSLRTKTQLTTSIITWMSDVVAPYAGHFIFPRSNIVGAIRET